MADIVEEWCQLIHERMIANNSCCVCGLAQIKDGAVFAGACNEGNPVDKIYKPDYQVPMPQEDGTETMTFVNEPTIIKSAAENLRAPLGLWIGGQKFKIVQTEEAYDQGDFKFKTLFCAKPRGGCCVVVTAGGIIILAIYSEELNQSSAKAKTAALDFGEYLSANGY